MKYKGLMIASAMSLMMFACGEESDDSALENAGDRTEEALDGAGDEMEEVGDEIEDELD